MSKEYKIYAIMILSLLSSGLSSAQEWIVPADKSIALSPFVFTSETRKAGETLFGVNCRSCHGDPGIGNAIALNPPPPDPAGAKMQKDKDGEIYFKIREGHGAMPSFKNKLSSSEIWNIVSFFRSFNKNYRQETAAKTPTLPGRTIISVNWKKRSNQIEASLINENNQVVKPLTGEEIQLSVIRYFGNLPVDKIKATNQEGKALFDFPSDLPGDSSGYLKITARVTDETKYGEIKTDTLLLAGIPTWRPPLNQERTMWNTVQKAPIWLLISYITAVLVIWGFIIYVLYLLRMIYLDGKQNQINQDSL